MNHPGLSGKKWFQVNLKPFFILVSISASFAPCGVVTTGNYQQCLFPKKPLPVLSQAGAFWGKSKHLMIIVKFGMIHVSGVGLANSLTSYFT